MPLKLIPKAAYQIQAWKNGLGTTSEIDVVKDDSSAAFVWRISAATVSQDNLFSQFPGLLRILSIWKGRGLWLNDEELQPYKPYTFSGDTKIRCRLSQGEVLDLGIIYDPKKVQAQLRCHIVKEETLEIPLNLKAQGQVCYFVAASGNFEIQGVHLTEGDTLKIESKGLESCIKIKAVGGSSDFLLPQRIFDVILNKVDLLP